MAKTKGMESQLLAEQHIAALEELSSYMVAVPCVQVPARYNPSSGNVL